MIGGANSLGPPKFRDPDCTCWTCDREIHHLGIMSHRAMHRRKKEDCKITFSTGVTMIYRFATLASEP